MTNKIPRKPVPANLTAESPAIVPAAAFPASPGPALRTALADLSSNTAVDELELWLEAKKQLQGLQPWHDYDAVVQLKSQDSGNKSIAEVVMAALTIAKTNYKDKQWSYTQKNGKKIVFAGIVDDIATCLDSVKGFGAAAAACDPTKAAGVAWAGIQFMVTASMNNKAIRDLVLDDQGSIAQIIQYCAIMERNYIYQTQSAQSESGQELRKALIELYAKILLYHVKAFAFIKESKAASAFAAFAPNQVRTVYKAMNDIQRLFERVKEWQQNIHGALLQASLRPIMSAVGSMDELLRKIDAKFSETQPLAPNNNRLELLGSEEAIKVTYPTMKEVQAISASPPWMRLLFLYSKSFPDGSDYVEEEVRRGMNNGTGSQIRLLDTLDVWRILCAEISAMRNSEHPQICINNMIFRVQTSNDTAGVDTLVTQLTDQDPAHLTTRIPSLNLAKQMLRNGQATPGGGLCGEKYHSSKNFDTVTFPSAFCMVSIHKEHQVYPRSWWMWGRNMQASLVVIVRDTWSCCDERTTGDYVMGAVVKEYCDGLSPDDWTISTGNFNLANWWKLRHQAHIYFANSNSSFEIEDAVTVLELIAQRPKKHLQADWIAKVLTEAVAYFQERATWFLLVALLNLSSNWWRAGFLPSPFDRLLSQEYCKI